MGAKLLCSMPSCGAALFTVMQWNILARRYTGYNAQFHRNLEAGPKGMEHLTQTTKRNLLVAQAILEQAPDAVLLQEVEPSFLSDPDVSPGSPALLDAYEPFTCFNEKGEPGVAILLRKGGRLIKPEGVSDQRVIGNRKTGGASKGTVLVPVRHVSGGRLLWVGSIHMTPPKYNLDKAANHLEQTYSTLIEVDPEAQLVIGGDFNADPTWMSQLALDAALLQLCPHMVALPAESNATGLNSDFSQLEHIDHMLHSAGITANGPALVERVPSSPWVDADEALPKVVGASDHVWVIASLTLDKHE